MKKIGIVMGSDSDLPVLEKAMTTLDKFGVPYEVHVYSAHRTPEKRKSLHSRQEPTALVPSSRQQARQLIWQAPLQPTQHCL